MKRQETEAETGRIEAKGRSGTVIFDGRLITIKRSGIVARAVVGKGEKRIPVSSVTAVQWKPAGIAMQGFIEFTIPGGNERRSRFGGQTQDARRDENSVTFGKSQMPSFEKIRNAVEQAISSPADSATAAAPDYLAQLRQLGELRDAGVVSDAEFEEKKAEILRRL